RVGGRADLRLHDFRFPLDFLEDASVDLVVSSLALDYIIDLRPSFKEFKRVLKPSGCLIFSMGHPTIDLLISDGINEYFKKHKFEIWWSGFKERVLMPTVHRPLQDITEALYESGFLIERLLETQPTLDYKKADPKGYEKVRKRPTFICVKALPRQ
ncbi:MAG: class I SAM-dependent methyltransferase, partial [Candidatus Bathyarchaeota archaeon]|nr:class I SAM-dependent methyltransferase [Candidatus Bathyarchaeota archaeon]